MIDNTARCLVVAIVEFNCRNVGLGEGNDRHIVLQVLLVVLRLCLVLVLKICIIVCIKISVHVCNED